jgi:glycosyltransferase involved in cell wall biosynthesis
MRIRHSTEPDVLSVLHVMTRMEPSGTELQLVGMLRASRQHWNPTLCVLYPGFPLAQQVADEGIELIELDGRSRFHLDRIRRLRRLARSGAYDVVHTSLWGASAFGRASVLGPSRPAVVMSERRVEDFRGRRRRILDQGLARATDEWIGNSNDVCDFVRRAHGAPASRVHLIRNGVDTDVFHPVTRARTPGRPARIGALGRLVHQKGFDVLLSAFRLIAADREIELVIAGDGELRAELEERAAGLPVTFAGSIKGAYAVADYLHGLDLFVMPSRYEGLPNAVIEAIACGVPVVATDVPGMREATGTAATLVPADDATALAAAVVASLADPPLGEPPAVRSFEQVATDHLQVFDLAVERRGRALVSASHPADAAVDGR